MRGLRSTGLAVALLALGACGRKEREKLEQETAAAEKQLAEARAFREGVEREKALLSQKITEARNETATARTAHHRTLAAAAWLVGKGGSPLELDSDMLAARGGFQLEEATRKKDNDTVLSLASDWLDSERPCVPKEPEELDPTSDTSFCGPGSGCEAPPPYEDACEDVPQRLSLWPDWTCDTLASTGGKPPAAAFCRATFEHPTPASVGVSAYAMDGLPVSMEVVRVAFEHEGHLYAADWPEPSVDLYHPSNDPGLTECGATNEERACVHQCDVQFDRYQDPCACEEYGDDEHDHDDGDSEEADEPAEVREARRAAEAAEAEVAEAQRRAEEAAQELSYRECLAACEPSRPEPAPTKDADGNPLPPEPARRTQTARLEASPAPGVFVVSEETKTFAADGSELEKSVFTYVLEHSAVAELRSGQAPTDAPDTLGSLVQHIGYEDVLRKDGKLSLAPLPGMKGPMMVGLWDGRVMAIRFSSEPGDEALEKLEPAESCAALRKEPKRFPVSYLEACDKPPAATPTPAVAAPAGADAGSEGKVAGEVTP